MSKVVLPDITSGYASTTQLNSALNTIEAEFQNKVLYRNNPTGEPNQMESDLDLNGFSILNAGTIDVNGVDLLESMQTIYDNYVALTQQVTISTSPPSGGADGDIWFQVSS